MILILAALFFGSSVVYTVKQDEVGVVQRFGKYVRTEQPGLNFKLPAGIEKVTKVNVTASTRKNLGLQPQRGSKLPLCLVQRKHERRPDADR